jgi:DNA-binding NarL/FixJ family response regulator
VGPRPVTGGEALVRVARGVSNTEIAGELGMSEATAVHVSPSLAKLDLTNRVRVALPVRGSGEEP